MFQNRFQVNNGAITEQEMKNELPFRGILGTN